MISELKLHRIGILMEPEPGNSQEVEGVLNPGIARGQDGQVYLFPRLVSKGNFSRIGIARVQFDSAGDPSGVERLGIALEPEADYELRPGGGGCEDPRVTFVEPLGHYLMTYTALSAAGPRIALAISDDLLHWRRLGLATFDPFEGIEFNGIDDKDACAFPQAVISPLGEPALAILHRPLFPGTRPEEKSRKRELKVRDLQRESIWISYRPMVIRDRKPEWRHHFSSHRRLAAPVAQWEHLKVGAGAPPVLTSLGWLLLYHGVREMPVNRDGIHGHCYSAGVMILEKERPTVIRYRSKEPVLTPELPEEKIGTVGEVVFPTGVDRRDDLNKPNRFDVYYGMADDKIGVARLDLPDNLN
jgi:predicted GH43/DUF377 family glycosyl hydrolase